MKYTNSTITRDSFFTKSRVLGLLLIIVAVLVACEEAGTGTVTEKDNRTSIEGTLSYVDIETPVGVEATRLPEITGNFVEQEVVYSSTQIDALNGISIDSSTGEITVSATVPKSSLDSYTVSVTGIGEYKGAIETTINIWVQAFAYDAVTITNSSIVTQSPPQIPAGAIFALKEQIAGLSIDDPTTGVVTVDPTLLSTGGTYVITLTEGTVTYDVGITIEDNRTSTAGTLSYTNITTDVGVVATRTPTWDGAVPGQTVKYSIARIDGSPKDDSITIDSSGRITVVDTAMKSTIDRYTVSTIGTGVYRGTIETTLDIWIQALSYDTVNISESPNAIIMRDPPSGLPTSSFALKEEVLGLSIDDPTTGVVLIDPTLLSTGGTYIIVITEGTKIYEVAITIKDNRSNIAGRLSFANITTNVGSTGRGTASWSATVPGQTVKYSIARTDGSPKDDGITIKSGTGEIAIAKTVQQSASGSYTISATGTGAYKGTIKATCDILIQVVLIGITGTLSYTTDITTNAGVVATRTPTWNGDTEGQEVAYSIARTDGSPKDDGITIDSSGTITVAATAMKSSANNSYTVSATGTGAYKGTTETTITIWVQAFSYDTVTISNSNTVIKNPPTGLPTSSFALKEQTVGLSIGTSNGAVTVDPTLLSTGDTYVIVITEGTKIYEVTITIELPKPANKNALKTLVNNAIASEGINVNLNYIDTSAVTDMSSIFISKTEFNGDISKWDTGRVTDMHNMFLDTRAFNGDISGWNVGNVTDMSYMFSSAKAFNGDISRWNVSNVTDMSYMFFGTSSFLQNLDKWNVASSVNKNYMFLQSEAPHPSWY